MPSNFRKRPLRRSRFLQKKTLSPVRSVLKVTLFLLLHCTGVLLCIWGVFTKLDLTKETFPLPSPPSVGPLLILTQAPRGRNQKANRHLNPKPLPNVLANNSISNKFELELELIQTHMTQKPMLRAEVGMRVRCANRASAGCIMRGRGIGQNSRKNCKKRGICG